MISTSISLTNCGFLDMFIIKWTFSLSKKNAYDHKISRQRTIVFCTNQNKDLKIPLTSLWLFFVPYRKCGSPSPMPWCTWQIIGADFQCLRTGSLLNFLITKIENQCKYKRYVYLNNLLCINNSNTLSGSEQLSSDKTSQLTTEMPNKQSNRKIILTKC